MSQFFDQASLVMIPSGYKDGKVYSQKPLSTDGELTFTRASNATRVGPDGLIEKVRTNLLLQSEAFNTTWSTYTGTTVTANAVSAPNGTLTADRIEGTSAAARGVYQSISTSAIPHTFSVYLKSATGSSTTCRIWVDSFASIITVTNDWQRFSVTGITAAGFGQFTITSAASSAIDVYAWGAQVETGDIATDYIPTTTAAVSVGPVANLPRLDYLGSSCGKLMLEGQRTNFIFQSEDFSAAGFQKLASGTGVAPVVTTNQGVAPTGYANADRIDFNIGAGTTASDVSRIIISTTSPPVAGSVYLKSLDGVSTYNMFLRVANTTTSIVVTGEWQRFSAVELSSGSNLQVGLQGDLATSASASILAFGAQLEQGSYPTSYINTLGAAVTRLADSASKTGIASLIGQSEGTLFAEFNGYENTGDEGNRIIAVGDGTSSTRILIFDSNTNIRFFMASGGTQVDYTSSVIAEGNHKVAIGYANNDVAMYIDGVQVSTDTNATIPACPNLYVGTREDGSVSTGVLAGSIKQALLFKTRLTNAQLAELTTL